MQSTTAKVAIVGGGITGLTTAWYLQQAGVDDVVVLESSDRWGGKIQTEKETLPSAEIPFILEAGPDSFLTSKPWAWQLAHELGLDDQFLPTNDHNRAVFVLNNGQTTPLPKGVMMMVPTEFGPFVRSPLISWRGKLRMGCDLFIPPKEDDADESLADFVSRRLGAEAVDKLAEPLMSGIYNADAQRQSVLATFARFREVERRHGSLIRGMVSAKTKRNQPQSSPSAETPPSAFVSFTGGMQTLVDALVPQLTADLRLATAVTHMAASTNATTLTLATGDTLTAEQVVLAVPAFVAAHLLQEMAPNSAEILSQMRTVSTGTLSLGYRRADVDHPLDGFGILMPRSERRRINAITWTSTKFDQRAPEDHALIRVFFGGSRTPQTLALPDDDLLAVVKAELADVMGLSAEPLFSHLFRWQNATPQYDVGHLERVSAVEQTLPTGLHVTGSPYRGIGIPDCVRQAKTTAETVAELLTSIEREGALARPS